MRRGTQLALVAAAAGLATLAGASLAQAEPPDNTTWSPLGVEGAPVDAGFLDAGYVVYGTTDADAVSGNPPGGDCTVTGDDADLFLVSFPGGPGCEDVEDTSDLVEGVEALATAREADRALVAVPADGSGELSGANLFVYELDDTNLTQAWSFTLDGIPIDVAVDPGNTHPSATFVTGSHDHRLTVFTGAGDVESGFDLPGLPRTLDVSENGRYVAVGGNVTQSGSQLGWAHLYDLTKSDDDNPVLERSVPRPRAGIVTSLAVTDTGTLYGGLLDGTVRLFTDETNDREVSLGTDPAYLAVDPSGDPVFAASGNETARLEPTEDRLTIRWRALVDGTAQSAFVRAPHLFAVAETVNAFGPEGDSLWEATAGDAVAVNGTGLGLAVGTDTSGTGQAPQTSDLRGRVLQRNVTIRQPDPVTVSPGGVARTNLSLANTGAAIVNLTPTASSTNLDLRAAPASLDLLPGRARNVSFTVQAEADASPGLRSVPVDPGARPPLPGNLSLAVDVTAQPNVTLEFAGGQVGDQDVTQGQTVTVRLALRNNGNADARVGVEVDQSVSNPWDAVVDPGGRVSVPGGSVTSVEVEIQVPTGVPNGTRNRVILVGDSPQGASSLQFNMTVNPFEVLRLRPRTVTQQMAPGETSVFDFSLENLGSVDARAELKLQPIGPDGETCLPTAWGAVLDASALEVPARGSQPVRVEVTGPAQVPVPGAENGTAACTGDAQRPTLKAELRARSEGGSSAESVLFANVDPSLSRDEETIHREPFPSPALIAVLVGSLAWALGRRQP